MALYSLEEQLNARGSDVLEFLEREILYIHPVTGPLGHKHTMEHAAEFYGERCGNIISIRMKTVEVLGKGREVIRLQVIEPASRISRVRAFYEKSDFHATYLFYRIWTKLAIAFGAGFAAQALSHLNTLQHHGG